MTALEEVDREIVREEYDSERAVKVLTRLFTNDSCFGAEVIWPAMAALVDARIRAIKPPRGMPKPEHKRVSRPRG